MGEVLVGNDQRHQHAGAGVCLPAGPSHTGLEKIAIPSNARLPDGGRRPVEGDDVCEFSELIGFFATPRRGEFGVPHSRGGIVRQDAGISRIGSHRLGVVV